MHDFLREIIEKSIDRDGLEIGNLKLHNKAFLAKWLWCFSFEPNSLWHKIIVSKYGPHPFEWLARVLKAPSTIYGMMFKKNSHLLIT